MIRLHIITTCLAFLTSVIACEDKGASGLESLRTTSGVPLYALSAGRDTVVLAIYDPADCLDCQGTAREWMGWQRTARSSRVYIIALSRTPTEEEKRQFALQRLQAVVLENLTPRTLVPRAYWIVNGEIRDSGVSIMGERALLRRLRLADSGLAQTPGSTDR